jgi:hypothetical protein
MFGNLQNQKRGFNCALHLLKRDFLVMNWRSIKSLKPLGFELG